MKRPWMPLYVDDYQRDTNRLSTLEHGAYLLLLMEYWRHGELPDDERALARIARLQDREWKKVRVELVRLFLPRWKHKRVEQELAEAEEISQRRKAAADERWSKERAGADANADAGKDANASTEQDANASTRALSRDTDHNSQTPSLRSGEARKRACRLPEDWVLPDEWRRWASERGYSDELITREAERMANWSRSSKGGAKLDWFATWRNWITDKPKHELARAGPNSRNEPGVLTRLAMSNRHEPDHDPNDPFDSPRH